MNTFLTAGLCLVSGIAILVCFSDWTRHLPSDSSKDVINQDGKEDQSRLLYVDEYNGLAYGKKSNHCRDSTGPFLVSNNRAVRMTCDDLRRPDYLFACTWSDVRKNCQYSCDSCSHDYSTSHDYDGHDDDGTQYLYNPDDDAYGHSTYDDTYGHSTYNNYYPTNRNTGCRDVEGKFRLKRNGEFIKCHMLRSRAYSDKCAWLRVQRKCPETCNVPCNDIQESYNNNRYRSNTVLRGQTRGQITNTNTRYRYNDQTTTINNNINNNRNRVRNYSPFDRNDDDFYDHGRTTVCQDSRSTFQLRPNGNSITCSDLTRNQYALACTWDRVKSLW